jgi:hypothetical protein
MKRDKDIRPRVKKTDKDISKKQKIFLRIKSCRPR